MVHDVIIIGGGLSGLSAAVELVAPRRHGLKICLLEQKRFLGGRTYSFTDKATGDVVDNGQHLLMGCYHETRRFTKLILSDHLAVLQPNLHIQFLRPGREAAALSCPSLPAPFHVLVGLLKLKSLTLSDRRKLLNVGMALLLQTRRPEELDSITVDEWLRQLGQSEENRKYLWDVIAVGSLNDDPAKVSALMFFRVLRTAFFGKKENASILIPKVGLSEYLIQPAERYLKSHGGEIELGVGVERIAIDGNRVASVECSDGRRRSAGGFILAIPHYDFMKLIKDADGWKGGEYKEIFRFQSSPIITINLWLDRIVFENEFAAVLDSNIQWIFNKTSILNTSQTDGRWKQYLSIVISGAERYIGLDKDEIVKIAMEDLCAILPMSQPTRVVHSIVIKEKRATFLPAPGLNHCRPGTTTPFQNLFLAGDWTDTGFPSTIEGAVLSGHKAANQVSKFFQSVS